MARSFGPGVDFPVPGGLVTTTTKYKHQRSQFLKIRRTGNIKLNVLGNIKINAWYSVSLLIHEQLQMKLFITLRKLNILKINKN